MMLRGIIFAALIAPSGLAAQQACAPHDIVVERLADGYDESRKAIALGSNNTVVEVFASESGSWSITVTMPGGPTCLVASGQAFELTDDPLPIDLGELH